MKNAKQTPPRIFSRFFRWYCHPKLLERIEGDLLEAYHQHIAEKGKQKADIRFIIDVLLLFRPAIIRPLGGTQNLNTFGMYKNYFKVGFRNLLKNKSYSLINISGLAIGLSCCMAIGLFVFDEFSVDRFHANINNLYRVVEKQKQAGVYYNIASTPGPLASAMKADLPEVQATCRIGTTYGTLQAGQTITEPPNIRFTDNSFFSLFSFNLIKGNRTQVLLQPDEILITSSTATALFGANWETRADLLGSVILLKSWGQEHVLRLTGIVEEPPANSHIQYSVLLSMTVNDKRDDFSWDNNSHSTYIALNPDADPVAFNEKIRTYIDRYSEYGSRDEARTLLLQPVKNIYLHSRFDFNTDDSKVSNILYVRIFTAVGLMVLLIAVFNFVNLATARATQRIKEVGVRKVIGALRRQLISQFLVESFVITLLAICLSLMLVQLLLPFLNDISGKSLYLPVNVTFAGVVCLSVFTISLLAGIYPAFYLSGFSPARGLKGLSKVPTAFSFRHVLVVGQFIFSVILIISSLVIYKQLRFIQHKELGFDRTQLVYMHLKNDLQSKASVIKEELKKQSSIVSISLASNNLVDATSSTTSIEWEGKQPEDELLMTHTNTDDDLISTMSMSLVAGRNFIAGGIDSASYMVNETAAKRMGWTAEEAVGKSLSLWKTSGTIVGVVKDFHFRPLTQVIEPFVFRSTGKQNFSGMFIKIQPGQTTEALTAIENVYGHYESKTDVHYEFVDQALTALYRMQLNTGRIVLFFSVLAILVSCLGLFGLATFAAGQRTKEIGIRKVLGANVLSVVQLLSGQFVVLVIVAIVIAVPIAYWSMNKWLQDFAYRITLEWWIFLIAGVMAISIAIATVSYQAFKAAWTNPVKSLRSE